MTAARQFVGTLTLLLLTTTTPPLATAAGVSPLSEGSTEPRSTLQAPSQEGTLTGQVLDAVTQQPLEGAQVLIVGTGIGALTNSAGRYVLENVPSGEAIVRVQLVGYATAEQTISLAVGGSAVADFSLDQQAIGLEEVVVTGLASETSRGRAEVAVSSITGDLAERVSYPSMSSLIKGKAAGVRVQQASGHVGSGVRFKLRGGGGLKGTGQPVIYVDGVRVDNSEVEGPSTGGQGFSMLATLDPQDIQKIDILKGPAAAALYGTSGSNGVVLITTKTGDPSLGERDTQFNLQSTIGFNERHADYSANEFLTYYGPNGEFVRGDINDNRLSLSGGVGGVNYFASVGRRHEEGILPSIWMDRYSLRANFEVVPTQNLRIDVNTDYGIVDQRAEDLDNAFGPLNNTLFISGKQLWSKTGSREAVYAQTNMVETNRFTGSLNLNWTPIQDFEFRATLGYDGSDLREDETQPVGYSYGGDTDGSREVYQRQNAQQNFNFNGRYTYDILPSLQATTIGGVQLFNRRVETTEVEKDVFPAEPLMNIGAGQEFIGADETALHERQAGLFLSQQLNWDNKVFATFAGRRDYSSVVGIEAPAIFYPKVSTAVRLDELGFSPGPIGFLKLRAAYGQSGQLPELLDGAGRLWGANQFGYGAGAVLESLGNSEIKPERVGEFEVGVDAEVARDYTVAFTYFNSKASESIVNYVQSPSTGLTEDDIPFNVGEISAWGLEADLEARLLQTQNAQLTTRLLWSYSTNEVENIGEAQPLFDGSNTITPGLPRSAFYALDNRGALFNEDGTYAGSDISFSEREFIGTPYPKHEGSFSVDFTFLEDFTLYGLSEWELDYYVYNATGLIAERYGNYAKRLRLAARIGDDRFRDIWAEEFPDIQQLEPGTDAYRRVANEYAMLDPQSTEGYIQRADYIGLSEISLSYNATDLLDRFGLAGAISNAVITASGQNVFISSKYEGPDPRLHWQGARTIGQSVDFTSLQHPRTFTMTLGLAF